MWNAIIGIIHEIKRCEEAGATVAAVAMAYICIDVMAFLSMPAGRTSQTREDFVGCVNTYLKGDPSQPYEYDGLDVYAARCALLHTFGPEAEIHRRDPTVRKFGYHDGGRHAYQVDIEPNLVIIGTASFLNDVVIAVESFIEACKADAGLRQRVEDRLSALHQIMPFPDLGDSGGPSAS